MIRHIVVAKQFRGPRKGRKVALGPFYAIEDADKVADTLRKRKRASGIEPEVVELLPGAKGARGIIDRLT